MNCVTCERDEDVLHTCSSTASLKHQLFLLVRLWRLFCVSAPRGCKSIVCLQFLTVLYYDFEWDLLQFYHEYLFIVCKPLNICVLTEDMREETTLGRFFHSYLFYLGFKMDYNPNIRVHANIANTGVAYSLFSQNWKVKEVSMMLMLSAKDDLKFPINPIVSSWTVNWGVKLHTVKFSMVQSAKKTPLNNQVIQELW